VVLALLPACASNTAEKPDAGYAGTVAKVYPVTLQGRDLPGMRFLGRVGDVLAPSLRKSSETNQYVVRTRTGQIMAQSDAEFSVGDCVEVIPRGNGSGPAFRYGQSQVVKSNECTTLTVAPR
jgi:hypothetical protein